MRRRLRSRVTDLLPTRLEDVPSTVEDEPLESLPLFFEPGAGRVAWRPHPGGVELFTLRDTGGIGKHLGVVAPPTRSPGLDDPARRLLVGYLRYVLERDATIGAAYDLILSETSELPETVVAADLREIASQVIRLGALRRSLTSDRRGVLNRSDVENGIRATDMDILDRPTAGVRL